MNWLPAPYLLSWDLYSVYNTRSGRIVHTREDNDYGGLDAMIKSSRDVEEAREKDESSD